MRKPRSAAPIRGHIGAIATTCGGHANAGSIQREAAGIQSTPGQRPDATMPWSGTDTSMKGPRSSRPGKETLRRLASFSDELLPESSPATSGVPGHH